VKVQAAETQTIKDDAQKDLDVALPAMNAAIEALNSLNKADITEMKSFKSPPPLVLMTMEGISILLGEPLGWDSAKKIMADLNFIKRLMEFNKDSITPAVQKKLQKYINDPQFLPEIVQKQSNAATSMCMWVCAMNVYADVAKVVAPKKAKLLEAETALKASADMLEQKQKQLSDVEAQVAELQANLDIVQADMDGLIAQASLTENRLIRAGKLTAALGDEAVRWRETAADIEEKRKLLVGDVFLCSVCISYYGAFSGVYREELVSSWIQQCKDEEIPVSND
jgi:dynein heavy chain